MHRVIAGVNLWALLFLLVSLILGATHARYHVGFALFATVFAMLAQSGIFALFMGASKLLKEHVEIYQLSDSLIQRTNALMIPLFRHASVGSLSVLLLAILGGLAISGDAPGFLHVVVAMVTIAVLVYVVPREVRLLASMHDVLVDMEAACPEDGVAVATAADGEQPNLRVRALIYIGSTCLAMVLGYKYIAGLPVSMWLLTVVSGFSLACLALAAVLSARGSQL